MFLLDTNCWMQIVRNRPDAPSVQEFLDTVPRSRLFISDFTLHSIGVAMVRFKQISGYISFLRGTRVGSEIQIIPIEFDLLPRIENACIAYGLDFDDAYQYAAAEIHKLQIVSFDDDFDSTPLGRLTPAAALKQFKDEQKGSQDA